MKVNHLNYALFDYTSVEHPNYSLGDVLYQKTGKGDEMVEEIGVIIQIHDKDECRTDSWGNSPFEWDENGDITRLATEFEIERLRPELLENSMSIKSILDRQVRELNKIELRLLSTDATILPDDFHRISDMIGELKEFMVNCPSYTNEVN